MGEDDIDAKLVAAESALEAEMASERATEHVRNALGHVNQARRSLALGRQERADTEERARIEAEAQADGTYDTFEDDPRAEEVES